jgi:hypothetical protein
MRACRAVGFAEADPIRFEAKRRFEPPKSLPELRSPLEPANYEVPFRLVI